MCWSSGMASTPPRRVSCPSRSRSLVCKIPIPLCSLPKTNTIGYYSNGSQAKLQERFCSGGIMTEKRPYCTRRTGTVTFTIIEAHPYHNAAYILGHNGAGEYEI